MNKYLFILGLVGTAVLTACSSDDLTTGFSPEDENALVAEASKDSDVPITLGLVGGRSSGMTRTPIESDDDDLFTIGGGQLGVFCLAAGKQTGAPSTVLEDINWKDDPLATWLNNVPASVKKEGGYSYVEFRKFSPSAAIDRYYPSGNWYYYDFYAYYPRVGSADISISAGSDGKKAYFASTTIDGTKDIIWGQAIGEDNSHQRIFTLDGSTKVYAYSSKFSRLNSAVVPEFDFKHKLTQLVFYVKAHDTAAAAEFSGSGIKVADLYLKDVDTKFELCIASMSNDSEHGYTPGKLKLPASRVQGNIKVYKTGTNSDAFDGGATTYPVATSSTDTDPKMIGYAMVPPIAASDNYEVQIVVKDGGENDYYNRSYTVTPPAEGFQAGKKYNIELDIKKK